VFLLFKLAFVTTTPFGRDGMARLGFEHVVIVAIKKRHLGHPTLPVHPFRKLLVVAHRHDSFKKRHCLVYF